MAKGFIKLHRRIEEWGWYSDSNTKAVFLHLLITANFKESDFLGHKIMPGQAVIGLSALSNKLGLSVQQVRTALKKLEHTGEIAKKTTNKFTVVTVVNWELYQLDEEITNKRATNEQQTNNKRTTNEQQHHKNVKNVKNVKNIKEIDKEKISALPSELQQAINDFADMRKKIKAPMTDRALNLMLNKLNALSGGDTEKSIAILNQSTERSWRGIFPIAEPKNKSSRNEVLDMLEKGEL